MDWIVFGRHKLDPRQLQRGEDNELVQAISRGVEVKCCYKQSSQWGVLTKRCPEHDRCPAWKLFMELKVLQPYGKLDYATLSLAFHSKTQGVQARHGVVITDDYGARSSRDIPWQFEATRSPRRESGDSLFRCITWSFKNVRRTGERDLSLSWNLWVVLRHDGEDTILIHPDIYGRLHGLNRIWAFRPRGPIQLRAVEPLRDEENNLNPMTGDSVSFEASAGSQTAPLTTQFENAINQVAFVLFDDCYDNGPASG